jgi:hypothetical protein
MSTLLEVMPNQFGDIGIVFDDENLRHGTGGV